MKRKVLRLLSLILMIIMALSVFGGCRKAKDSPSNTSSTAAKSSASAKTSSAAKTKSTSTKDTASVSSTKTTATISTAGGTSTADTDKNGDSSDSTSVNNSETSGQDDGNLAETQPKSDIIVAEQKIDLGGMTLTVWAPWFSDPDNGDTLVREGISPYYDALLSSIKDAEKKYNCKIVYSNPAGDERQGFLQEVMAGQVPVTTLEANLETAMPAWSDVGVVARIDDYIDFNSPLITDFPIKGIGAWKGIQYGYPAPVAAPGNLSDIIHYNRELFAQYAVEDPQDIQDRGQWTWETFIDVATKLTVDMNGDGVIDQYALGTHYGDLAHDLMYSNGARVFRFDENNMLKLTALEAQSLKALNFASDLINIYKVVWNPKTSWVNAFRARKVAMLINGVPTIKYHKDNGLSDDIGLVSMPTGPDSPSGNYSNVGVTSRAFFFPSTLDRKEDVIPVICDAMTNWDKSKTYFQNGGNGGNTFTAWEGIRRPQDVLSPRDDAYVQRYADTAEVSNEKCLANFTKTFNDQINKAFNQETSLMTALESIQNPLQAILDGLNN